VHKHVRVNDRHVQNTCDLTTSMWSNTCGRGKTRARERVKPRWRSALSLGRRIVMSLDTQLTFSVTAWTVQLSTAPPQVNSFGSCEGLQRVFALDAEER